MGYKVITAKAGAVCASTNKAIKEGTSCVLATGATVFGKGKLTVSLAAAKKAVGAQRKDAQKVLDTTADLALLVSESATAAAPVATAVKAEKVAKSKKAKAPKAEKAVKAPKVKKAKKYKVVTAETVEATTPVVTKVKKIKRKK